jgi:uncharacterized membrane protein
MTARPATTVVVLLLPDLRTARGAADAVHEATVEGRFAAEDVVIVEHEHGRVRLHHGTASRPLTSFAGGALLGGLAGLLVGSVVAPALLLGSAAAVITKLSDRSIPKPAIEALGEALREGQVALLVLTDTSSARMIADETFANSTVSVFELHPEDAASVAAVADEIAVVIRSS